MMLGMKVPVLGGWAKWALGTAILLWTTFLLFIYSCMFQHDFCDASRRLQTAALYCSRMSSELERIRGQLQELQADYSSLLEENGQLQRLLQQITKQPPQTSSDQPSIATIDTIQRIRSELAFQRRKIAPDKKLHRVDPRNFDIKSSALRLYSKEHELQRRQLHNELMELYFFSTNSPIFSRLNMEHQERLKDQLISAISDSFKFSEEVDDARGWHRHALEDLGKKIQAMIDRLQNPEDCSNAKLLICDFNKACGFGCQIHHVVYCLIVATASNRTLVLDKNGSDWKYSRRGWNAAFEPITNCTYKEEVVTRSPREQWTTVSQTARIVYLPVVDVLNPRPPQLPLSIPTQFSDYLLTHSSNPPVFMVSQFLSYAMRENAQFLKILAEAEAKIQFKAGPIVGLHVRRTDKVGTEATFHALDDYMEWAEFWFRVEEKRRGSGVSLKRRVFIATDDKNVVNEARKRYGGTFEVFANDGNAETAQLSSRYTEQSLAGVITDVRLLSKCDYIVCTFSSQICRVAYELASAKNGDMAERIHSLDDIYYFGGQHAHNFEAMQDYNAKDAKEIDLQKGDTIGIAGNHWNGYSKGTNRRTGKLGLFPSYIAREQWKLVDFPLFNNILPL